MTFEQCPAGTFNPSPGATSNASCIGCPVGKASPIPGSSSETVCTACLPGSYAEVNGTAICSRCEPGKFTGSFGQTACEDCTPGYLCVEGSSAPQPCPGGTHANQTVLNMSGFLSSLEDECIICPAGTSCSVGSGEPRPCRPGSFSAVEKSEVCTLCSPGEYQDAYEQTSCKTCTRGFYCEVGTAKPTPCPAGTASNVTGVSSEDQCIKVEVGFWAPLGSAIPETCPASGFYCPGAEKDDLYGGSKPIIMPFGGSTEEVEVVEKEMTLDMSCADFDYDALIATLAEQYGVDLALISFPNPCEATSRRTLSLQSSGLSITITIATSVTTEDGTVISAFDDSGGTVDDLLSAVEAVTDGTLATFIGEALGTTVTVATEPAGQAITTVSFECPKGKWCTAGLVVDCPLDTFNNLTGQDFATACKLCPPNSHTEQVASQSADDCVCDAGFYDDIIGPNVDCKVCPTGTDCKGGATLERMPLRRAFFRKTNDTTDVRKCPDHASNCSTTFGQPGCFSTSGCLGGEDVDEQCNTSITGLTGMFCMKCAPSPPGSPPVYYVAAKSGDNAEAAHCAVCDMSTLGQTIAIGVGVLAAVLMLLPLLQIWMRKNAKRIAHLSTTYSPMNKIKILFTFYMISTKVDNVYSVSLPQEVKRAIDSISVIIALGLNGVATTPLECLGLSGYVPRLLFWMILPFAVSFVIIAVVVASRVIKARGPASRVQVLDSESTTNPHLQSTQSHGGLQIDLKQSSSADAAAAVARAAPPTFIESVLPPFNLVMFLLYPRVTQIAFEGFPCYRLVDGTGYLMADVGIQCGTTSHNQAKFLAWVAVIIYPIGLMVFNAVLLFRARKAILDGKPTPLSRSIAFLYKEFDPTIFWWEVAEMLRKFLLVGLFVTVEPGTITQISLGTIVCAVYLLIQMQAAPYKNKTDDYLAVAGSFALLMIFFCSVIYKYQSLTESQDVKAKMSHEQKEVFVVPALLLSVILIAAVFGSLLFAMVLVIIQAAAEARKRMRLRLLKFLKTGKEVVLEPLQHEQAFHLFLSHAWPAAQDRMRIIKARFAEALPTCRVFLDVDDLKSGSGTAEVDRSECILVFCTKAYFEKKNSLKELYRAVCQRRPILAVLEPDERQDGGLNREAVTALLSDACLDKFKLRKKWKEWKEEGELSSNAFDHAPNAAECVESLFAVSPVEWNRLPHFQDVTIRLIAEKGILHGVAGELYLQGEAAMGKVTLPEPLKGRTHHLFCSEFNSGAKEVAEELKTSDVIVAGMLKYTVHVDQLEQCDHMLILLDQRTWTSGETTAKLVEHIHEAMRKGVHLCCVHEFPSVVGPPRYECEFALMFNDDWTPPHLTSGATNLYKEIALALKGLEWRKPGFVAFASKLAESAGPHEPISFSVPRDYVPKTGASKWTADGQAYVKKIEMLVASFDADNDYVVSASELHTLLARAEPKQTMAESQKAYDEMMASGYDTNGDGRLSVDELAVWWLEKNPLPGNFSDRIVEFLNPVPSPKSNKKPGTEAELLLQV
jgi:hypothetical protein